MPGKPAARRTDMTACPMMTPGTPPVPHVGGPIMMPCSPNVFIGGLPAARVTDVAYCAAPPPTHMDAIIQGSTGVFINGLMAARMGDATSHGGKIVTGFPTVHIGDGGGGGGMSGFGAGAAAADALKRAAKDGKPFCEECYQAAEAQAK